MTDDELRARVNGTLQALAAELDRALDGRDPNRGATLDVARKYRALMAWANTMATRSVRGGERQEVAPGVTAQPYYQSKEAREAVVTIEAVVAAARDRVVQVFGTSAWDEPERPSAAPSTAGPDSTWWAAAHGAKEGEPPPLTDEELDEIMAGRKFGVGHDYAPEIERLVAEIRRLRSDDPIKAAAREIGINLSHFEDQWYQHEAATLEALEEILRRHRDGR